MKVTEVLLFKILKWMLFVLSGTDIVLWCLSCPSPPGPPGGGWKPGRWCWSRGPPSLLGTLSQTCYQAETICKPKSRVRTWSLNWLFNHHPLTEDLCCILKSNIRRHKCQYSILWIELSDSRIQNLLRILSIRTKNSVRQSVCYKQK